MRGHEIDKHLAGIDLQQWANCWDSNRLPSSWIYKEKWKRLSMGLQKLLYFRNLLREIALERDGFNVPDSFAEFFEVSVGTLVLLNEETRDMGGMAILPENSLCID